MAIIDFQILGSNNAEPSLQTLSGSGLGFFGATAGSSVQIGSYQDSTYVSNGDGSVTKDQTVNVKYVADTYPSGMCSVDELGAAFGPVGLSGVKSFQSTLGIRFGHTSAVKTQNAQLRIYDRTNINYPASGVNTKAAEIVNFNGSSYNTQGTTGVSSNAVGSGDCFWWGEAWPSELVTTNYYQNSLGTRFYNGLETSASVNGDVRLGNVTDDDHTVGGTGVILPLLDSPGSGQRGLAEITDNGAASPGLMWPKWSQYVDSADQAGLFGASNSFGNGHGANIARTYGGTGYHTHHTWAVALSASPLNIGSKEQYGLYVSLEYL
jgi:hypothetical protein